MYSNVTEQDLVILRLLAELHKNQRAEKIKNRILKQTHDIKSAESLSPITKKIDEVKKSTQKVGKQYSSTSQRNDPQCITVAAHLRGMWPAPSTDKDILMPNEKHKTLNTTNQTHK